LAAVENLPRRCRSRLHNRDQIPVGAGDEAFADQIVPVDRAAPEFRADQHDGNLLDLAGLHERQHSKELIQRSEAARAGDESVGVFGEHELPDHEEFELDPEVHIGVRLLLPG